MMSTDFASFSGFKGYTIHEDILIRLTNNKAIGNPDAKMYTTQKRLRGEFYTVNIYRTFE